MNRRRECCRTLVASLPRCSSGCFRISQQHAVCETFSFLRDPVQQLLLASCQRGSFCDELLPLPAREWELQILYCFRANHANSRYFCLCGQTCLSCRQVDVPIEVSWQCTDWSNQQ